jgi:hypothetical protein
LHPDVVILDAETVGIERAAQGLTDLPDWQAESTPVLLLGRMPMRDSAGERRQMDKPYHYAPLLRTIEELWGQTQQRTQPGTQHVSSRVNNRR